MTVAVPVSCPPQNSELGLASALFLTLTDREQHSGLPPDGIYRDCLTSLALNHLLKGVEMPASPAELKLAADAISNCEWLTYEVRDHLSNSLSDAADDKIPRALLVQFVTAAMQRNTHSMVIDCVRAVGSDGLREIADAIERLAPANEEEI